MEAAVALRDQLKEMLGTDEKPPSFNDFVVKAAATALRHSRWPMAPTSADTFSSTTKINIGIAVAAPDALVVPTISTPTRSRLGRSARNSRELAQKVRDQTITPPELSAERSRSQTSGCMASTSLRRF